MMSPSPMNRIHAEGSQSRVLQQWAHDVLTAGSIFTTRIWCSREETWIWRYLTVHGIRISVRWLVRYEELIAPFGQISCFVEVSSSAMYIYGELQTGKPVEVFMIYIGLSLLCFVCLRITSLQFQFMSNSVYNIRDNRWHDFIHSK